MSKANIDLIKFYFFKKFIASYFIVFIDKKLRISLFINNKNAFAILANELINNIV